MEKTTEFKVSQDDGNERRETTVSISLLDLKKFNQIKGHLSYFSGQTVSSQEVMAELINAWVQSKKAIELGESS